MQDEIEQALKSLFGDAIKVEVLQLKPKKQPTQDRRTQALETIRAKRVECETFMNLCTELEKSLVIPATEVTTGQLLHEVIMMSKLIRMVA